MKFSNVLMFASFAFAAPTVEVRQQTAVGVVVQSVQTVLDTTNTNLAAIRSAVQGITGNIDAQVEATIRANLNGILTALESSTTAIVGATTGAAGGIIGAASGLTQQQVNDLAQALQNTITAVSQLELIITAQATDLTPALRILLNDQLTAIRAALNPFVAPLINFARAVQAFSARVGVTVTGLGAVATSLTNYITTLLNSLGLGFILPLIPGLLGKRANL